MSFLPLLTRWRVPEKKQVFLSFLFGQHQLSRERKEGTAWRMVIKGCMSITAILEEECCLDAVFTSSSTRTTLFFFFCSLKRRAMKEIKNKSFEIISCAFFDLCITFENGLSMISTAWWRTWLRVLVHYVGKLLPRVSMAWVRRGRGLEGACICSHAVTHCWRVSACMHAGCCATLQEALACSMGKQGFVLRW
jgi:hypothetical protein